MNTKELSRLTSKLNEIPNTKYRIFPAQDVVKNYQELYHQFLGKKYHANLTYLEDKQNIKARFNFHEILPNTKTMIAIAFFYNSKNIQFALKKARYKIARYAWGRDYHNLCRSALKKVMRDFSFGHRLVSDTTPLPERYLAHFSGLARPGRNGLMIDKEKGSYFLLSFILLQEELPIKEIHELQHTQNIFGEVQLINPNFKGEKRYQQVLSDVCGDCTLCIKACPTKAIDEELGLVDSKRCISYHTIESKQEVTTVEVFPNGIKKNKWIFGCDICQMVCPYNKGVKLPQTGLFDPWPVSLNLSNGQNIEQNYAGSALKRPKVAGLKRNIDFVDMLTS